MRSDACMDEVYIEDPRVLELLCYPHFSKKCVEPRLRYLRSLSINTVCLEGNKNIVLPYSKISVKVLGKGHQSVVLIGKSGSGIVAIKIRRTDSKKPSLADEAKIQQLAAMAGVAPQVYYYSDDLIVMEYIYGNFISDYFKDVLFDYSEIRRIVREALESARVLDAIGILHNELSRPHHHIIIRNNSSKAIIIDYDSATFGSCGNVAKVVSWFLRVLNVRVDNELKHLLSFYKRKECKFEIYLKIAEKILDILSLK